MCVDSEIRNFFGVFHQNNDKFIITNGFSLAEDHLLMHKRLKELNTLNIEKAILKNEVSFIFKYLLVVDHHRRGDHYAREFPLHKINQYILRYYEVVEAEIDLFSKASRIINNFRFGKNVHLGNYNHPNNQEKILEFVAEIKEPLLKILKILKISFQETDFKNQIKVDQKYFSKMKIKYIDFAQDLIDSANKFEVMEYNLYTRDYSFDHYTSGSICTINFDAILDDLQSDREIFIDSIRKEFSENFIGCIWKLNHSLFSGFYLSFLFFMKDFENKKKLNYLSKYLNDGVFINKIYKLITPGTFLGSTLSGSECILNKILRYIMMDSVFNLKIEGYKTLGRVGFKSIAKCNDLID